MSQQKELYVDLKAIQGIKFLGQLKNTDNVNADGTHSMFVWKILEKIKETRLKWSKWSLKQSYRRWRIIKKCQLN